LMLASFIFTIISFVIFLTDCIGNVGKMYKVGVVFLIITMILVAVAPIYFMFALPQAIIKDTQDIRGSSPIDSFIGSKDVEGIKTSWGPGYAWYLTSIAFIFLILTLIVTLLGKKRVHVFLKKGGRKQKEEMPEEYISKEIKPMMVKCPYCNTTFNITPTKKPFKIKCPSCNKKSMLR